MPEPQDTTQIQGLPPGAILKPIQQPQIEGLPPGAVLKPISSPDSQQTPATQTQAPAKPLSPFHKGLGEGTLAGWGLHGSDPSDPRSLTWTDAASQTWENLKNSAKNSFNRMAKATGEDEAAPIIGQPFALALTLPEMAASGIEGMASTIQEGAKDIYRGVKTSDHESIGRGTGKILASLGQIAAGMEKGPGEAVMKSAANVAGKAVKAIARTTDVGGLTPVEAIQKAGRPTVYERDFVRNAQRALPRIAEESKLEPVKTPQDFAEAAHSAAQKLWQNEITPQITKHATEIISGKAIADAVRNGVDAGTQDMFPEEAAKAEDIAKKFDGDLTLEKASQRLQTLNGQLRKFYKLDPSARYAAGINDVKLAAMEDAADALRDQIYSKLESLGETDPAGLRKDFGALKQMERVFEKRATVHGRQAPLNLPQVVGAIAAVAHGGPVGALVGAIPYLSKYLNAPETLIKGAIKDTTRGPKTPGVKGKAAFIGTVGSKEESQDNSGVPIADGG